MNRELLEQPFSQGEIKQRKGRNHQMMDYIEGHTVVQRLNDIFDAEWKFNVVSYEVREDFNEVVVLGKLTVPGAVRMQFGSSQLTRAKDSGKIIAVGDDLKSAATDALKKSASLLGVGLYLYRKDKKPASPQTGATLHAVPESHSQIPSVCNQVATNRQQPSILSQSQNKYLHSLARQQGIPPSELAILCQERFSVAVNFLSKENASAMIEELKRPRATSNQPQGQVA